MRSSVLAALALAACGAPVRPSPPSNVAATEAAAPAASPTTRCLPVVAAACGCVYSCGLGTFDGKTWTVHHEFWDDLALNATVAPWCVDGQCTDAFSAEIVCAGICAPRPADPTCHLDDAGRCVGRPPS